MWNCMGGKIDEQSKATVIPVKARARRRMNSCRRKRTLFMTLTSLRTCLCRSGLLHRLDVRAPKSEAKQARADPSRVPCRDDRAAVLERKGNRSLDFYLPSFQPSTSQRLPLLR